MKGKKGWVGTLCTIVALSSIAAGCGNNGNTASKESTAGASSPAATAQTKPVHLRFAWWGGDARHKATQDAIALYKTKFPNVGIEGEFQGYDGYEQKLKTQLAGGTSADLMQVDTGWLQDLASRGDLFVDLAKQLSMDLSGFDEKFLKDYGMLDNQVLGVPLGTNASIVIANQTLADKLGISLDRQMDWDTLLTDGKRIHDLDKKYYLVNSDVIKISLLFKAFVKQRSGQQWVNEDYSLGFTQEDAAAAFAWLQKAYEVGVFQPLGEAALFPSKTEQNPKWINQEVVLNYDWTSSMNTYVGTLPEGTEVAVILPPIAKDAKDTAVLVRPASLLAISNKSANVEEAVKFANWFVNDKDAAVTLGDVRAIPAVPSSAKAAMEAGKIDKTITAAIDAALQRAGNVENALSNLSETDDILKDEVQKVAYNKASPDQAADELVERLNEKLKEIKNRTR